MTPTPIAMGVLLLRSQRRADENMVEEEEGKKVGKIGDLDHGIGGHSVPIKVGGCCIIRRGMSPRDDKLEL